MSISPVDIALLGILPAPAERGIGLVLTGRNIPGIFNHHSALIAFLSGSEKYVAFLHYTLMLTPYVRVTYLSRTHLAFRSASSAGVSSSR
jgi:hypothetical protein